MMKGWFLEKGRMSQMLKSDDILLLLECYDNKSISFINNYDSTFKIGL